MSIDEAITHCLEVADGQTEQGRCPECAEDHRQLAKWLTDYKRLKEQESKTGHWTYFKAVNTSEIIWSECSECKDGERGCAKRMKYCPNCGCRMVEPPAESEGKDG